MRKAFFFAAVAAIILAGCSKETERTPELTGDGTEIVATAVAPGAFSATKVAYNDGYSAVEEIADITSSWESGDSFTALEINGSTITTVKFSTTGSGASAQFVSEGAVAASDNTKWVAVSGNATVEDGVIVCKYSEQDGSLENLGNLDYSVANATGKAPVFDFAKGTRLTYVMRVLLPAGIKYIEYNTGTTNSGGWNVDNLGKSKGTTSSAIKDAVSVMTLPSASIAGQIAYIAVPAINCMSSSSNRLAGIVITIMSSDKKLSQGKVTSPDLTGKGGCIGTYDMSELTLTPRPLPSEAIKLGSVTCEGKTFKLGSWAPFVVGGDFQTSDEAIKGSLFSWGEIEPKEMFSRDSYRWNVNGTYTTQLGYKYIGAAEFVEPYIEYCVAGGPSTPTHGPGTYYDIGGTKYDAARVKWGCEWRMASNEIAGNLMKDSDAVIRFGGNLDKNGDLLKITAYEKGIYTNSLGYKSNLYGVSVFEANGAKLELYYSPWTNGDSVGTLQTNGDQGRFWTATTNYGQAFNANTLVTGSNNYWNRAVHTRFNTNNSHYMSDNSYIWNGLPIRPVLNE